MISALAVGGRVLAEPRWVAAAGRAAAFAMEHLRVEGRLRRSWRDGRTSGPGFLEDQAFMVQGLLDLHQASLDPRWLESAIGLAILVVLFRNRASIDVEDMDALKG